MGTYTGTSGDDSINHMYVSPGVLADPLDTLPGDDNDTLYGLAGDDSLNGAGGNDILDGGADDDYLYGGAGQDTLYGGEGNDELDGGSEGDTLYGGAGSDYLFGASGGDDAMYGGAGDDFYWDVDFDDLVAEDTADTPGGYDRVYATTSFTLGYGLEELNLEQANGNAGGTGNDLANKLIGNNFDNVLDGKAGADTMAGQGGSDTYYVDDAGDVVLEEVHTSWGTDTVVSSISYVLGAGVENLTLDGSDRIDATGNGLRNWLIGNAETNLLSGGAKADRLEGLEGDDRLKGGRGNDYLDGGDGKDTLTGGGGNDEFVIAVSRGERDIVTDFHSMKGDNDKLILDLSDFGGFLHAGKLSGSEFQAGAGHGAHEAAIRFIFDTSNTTLWFDTNGSASGGLTLIANLQANAVLELNDILLI